MASINGGVVTVFQGRMRAASRRSRLDDGAVGVNSSLVVRSSWKADPVRIHTEYEVSGGVSAARTLIDAYRALMLGSATISVVDQFGETWSNVTVLEVTAEPYATLTSVSAGLYRVCADWTFLPASASP